MISPNKHELAVAAALGVTIEPAPNSAALPLLRWHDGFMAEISIDEDGEWFDVAFFALLREPEVEHPRDLVNRKLTDLLRVIQRYAAPLGQGIRIETESRTGDSHILDHLGFRISQETIDDNEFWGEDFDDANYEWRPE